MKKIKTNQAPISDPNTETKAIAIPSPKVEPLLLETGASYICYKYNNGRYVPYSWGGREKVRRSLENTDKAKWKIMKEKINYFSTTAGGFIKYTFVEPVLKRFKPDP